MSLSETRKGELFVFGEALLWSLFPIVTILSYSAFSPILSLAWSTFFACLIFVMLMLVRGRGKELFYKGIFKLSFLSAFFIGWLFYGLFFYGLKFTNSDNASIIALMELFFAFLLFNIFHKQPFSARYKLGAVLMLLGAVIILYPHNGWSFHGGDWLVLAASACAPFGNYYQQKLRQIISSETLLFLRSLFTFPIFFFLAYILKTDSHWQLSVRSFWLLLFNGFVVLGISKIMWIEGIHRISVTKADALASLGPLFTVVFAYLILRQQPTVWQLLSFVPLAAGLILLTYQKSSAM